MVLSRKKKLTQVALSGLLAVSTMPLASAWADSGVSEQVSASGIEVSATPTDISTCTVADIADIYWTGKPITPEPVVSDGATKLVKNTDYTLSYADNVKKSDGTDLTNTAKPTITIEGKGGYSGSMSKTFNIRTWGYYFTDTKDDMVQRQPSGSFPWYVSEDYWLDYCAANTILRGYSSGPSKGCFGPYDNITRAQVVTMLYRIEPRNMGNEVDNYPTKFSDVPGGMYYTASVKWANNAGIVTGYEGGENAGKFLPDAEVSREEIAVMIARYAAWKTTGQPDVPHRNPTYLPLIITDMDQVSPWARDAVAWCLEKGIIAGIKDKAGSYLAPQDPAWRASMAKMTTVTMRDVLGKEYLI